MDDFRFATDDIEITGTGDLPSVFPVTDLAVASVGAACQAIADLIAARHGRRPAVSVDRRIASFWFATSIFPQGWALPPVWDVVAGVYRTSDGWIRLHTNVPAHRDAALAVLHVGVDRDAVAAAVAHWQSDALESAVVAAGGCAAALRSMADWAAHPHGRAVAAEPLLHVEMGTKTPAPSWAIPADRPLRGIRVLDMTRVLAGPVATRFLAGFGATVLRIDPPWWDEPALVPDVTLGKTCARLDLRNPADRETWRHLLAGADVLVHGYRPGALAGLGLDADMRRQICPGLVDVSLDAYGWSGPWQGRRGFDSLVQMSSGIAEAGMTRLGRDEPTPLPVQALDHAVGYLLAAAAIRGLTRRLVDGTGSISRSSLARMAAVLTSLPPGDPSPLAPVNDGDFAAEPEATSWGPARRLRPHGTVAGAKLRWESPATALGTSPAQWPPAP